MKEHLRLQNIKISESLREEIFPESSEEDDSDKDPSYEPQRYVAQRDLFQLFYGNNTHVSISIIAQTHEMHFYPS